jgi:hypothetical protein
VGGCGLDASGSVLGPVAGHFIMTDFPDRDQWRVIVSSRLIFRTETSGGPFYHD